MREEDKIDWRPLKWLAKVVVGIVLAAPMAFLLELWAYNSNRLFSTPGMKYAREATRNIGGIGGFGEYVGLSLKADVVFCFVVLCCLNYAYKLLRKNRDLHEKRVD